MENNESQDVSSESPETIKRMQEVIHYFKNQKEFAQKIDTTQSFLSLIIRGKKRISATVIRGMMQLNIDLYWLYKGIGNMFITPIQGEHQFSGLQIHRLKDELLESKTKQINLMDELNRYKEENRQLKERLKTS